VLDAKSHICLGLANVEVFKRESRELSRNKERFENKQSYRWFSSVQTAKDNCGSCEGVTVISDREGDIYDAMCGYKLEGMDFLIRSWHNRPLAEDDCGITLQNESKNGINEENIGVIYLEPTSGVRTGRCWR